MTEQTRSRLQVVLSEVALVALLGLVFNAGIMWSQLSEVRSVSQSHITRVEYQTQNESIVRELRNINEQLRDLRNRPE